MVPNQTLCADGELVRVGFMVPDDVRVFAEALQQAGFEFLRDGEAADFVVVDQQRGCTVPCQWAEFGHVHWKGDATKTVGACRLSGSSVRQVVTPPGWQYEGSLSASCRFVPGERVEKDLQFVGRENGRDVYLNLATGEKVYAGRTSG